MTQHLKNIKIKGFKSIAELDLAMEDINILIGANGAGKTNFISVFTFLHQLYNGKLTQYIKTQGGAERFFHFSTKQTEMIVLDLEVSANGYHVEFLQNVNDDSLVFNTEYCTFEESYRSFQLYPQRGESGFLSEYADSGYVKEYTEKFLKECRVYHFHDTSDQAQFKKTKELTRYAYLEKDAANIAPFLYHLKTSPADSYKQAYKKIVSVIQSIAPFFHDFYLEPYGEEGNQSILLRWTHTESDIPFSANTLSDGTARFICLATLFLQPPNLRPSTIIIDEPELGLHPSALNTLADIIHAISQETQVICSTQSIAFANLFAASKFIVVDAEVGVSSFRRLEKEQIEDWLEEYGVGDIWSKNIIGGRPAW